MQDLWVWIRFSQSSEKRIGAIQEALEPVVPSTFEAESDLHLSVLPGVSIPREVTQDFITAVAEIDIENDDIGFTGIEWHPSQGPYAITIGVDIDLESTRIDLLDIVDNLGGTVKYEPVKPHVTLFKSGDSTSSDQISSSEELANLQRRAETIESDPSLPTDWSDNEFQLEVEPF